jgi:mRNA interferase MazF
MNEAENMGAAPRLVRKRATVSELGVNRISTVRTSLVIGLPMTTAEYNADNPFAVAVGLAKGRGKDGKTSYVLCHQPKSFDWRTRGAKAHPMDTLPVALFAEVCERLNQIIRLA